MNGKFVPEIKQKILLLKEAVGIYFSAAMYQSGAVISLCVSSYCRYSNSLTLFRSSGLFYDKNCI